MTLFAANYLPIILLSFNSISIVEYDRGPARKEEDTRDARQWVVSLIAQSGARIAKSLHSSGVEQPPTTPSISLSNRDCPRLDTFDVGQSIIRR